MPVRHIDIGGMAEIADPGGEYRLNNQNARGRRRMCASDA